MQDDVTGTWEEVIERNEQELREFERRVLRSQYKELNLWRDHHVFTIGQGRLGTGGAWYIDTPQDTYYMPTLDEVLQQAELHGYPAIRDWLPEFNSR